MTPTTICYRVTVIPSKGNDLYVGLVQYQRDGKVVATSLARRIRAICVVYD